MLRREGRLDTAPRESAGKTASEVRDPVPMRNWEKPIFVLALIIILVLGGIAGMNSLIALVR